MLPESEINQLITELELANEKIDAQQSRIQFLQDNDEDATQIIKDTAAAVAKRDKFQRALQKQIDIFEQGMKQKKIEEAKSKKK